MKIVIGGDFFVRNRCEEMVLKRDYGFLEDVRSVFKASDFNIINLEGPFKTDGSKPISKYGPNLHMPLSSLDILKYLGVTNVTLANNHILDYGEEELESTINHLKEKNIGFVGAGSNYEEAETPMILKKGNLKVGVLNYCESEFSIISEECGGANHLNCVVVYNNINELRKKVDYIIVIVHGGHENFNLPSMKMINEYRYMIDIGADLIVNHHQHCISGIEEYKGKKIYYGIGNLCFDKLGNIDLPWYKGILVTVNITPNDLTSSYIPYEWEENPFKLKILPLDCKLSNEIKLYSSIINNTDELKSHLMKYYSKRENGILNTFEPYNNRVLNKLYRLGLLPSFLGKGRVLKLLNLIECESHSIVTIKALKNKINNK